MRTLLQERARLLQRCRAFFADRNVIEADSPTLWPSTIPDPNIESFHLAEPLAFNPNGRAWFLQTSPEFALKRLVAASGLDLYEIKHVFRNEPLSPTHHPEFLMAEWYRQGFDDHRLMREVADLLQILLERPLPVEILSFNDAFVKHLNLNLKHASIAELSGLAQRHCHYHGPDHSKEVLTDLLMGAVIGPQLGREGICFITDYPIAQAALAKARAHDPTIAARFEAYYKGVELCNGFDELTDSQTQRSRFIADNETRLTRQQPPIPLDEPFLHALDQLPACAGVALGLDRVLQIKLQAERITDVIPLHFKDL